MRAKSRLARAVIEAMCSDHIARVIDSYDCEKITRDLVYKSGFVMTIIPVGHGPDQAARENSDGA